MVVDTWVVFSFPFFSSFKKGERGEGERERGVLLCNYLRYKCFCLHLNVVVALQRFVLRLEEWVVLCNREAIHSDFAGTTAHFCLSRRKERGA